MIKDKLSSSAILKLFSAKLETTITTDASRFGMETVREQNGHPVICLSHYLTQAEQGFSQIQLDALSVIWALRCLHK